MDGFKELIGLKVSRFCYFRDNSIGIEFDKGEASLSIFNRYKLSHDDASRIIEQTLEAIEHEQNQSIEFRFSNNFCVTVGLDDSSWSGPEAMLLKLKDKTIVWNE